MFEVMGRLWAAITGRNGKQQEKADSSLGGVCVNEAGQAAGTE